MLTTGYSTADALLQSGAKQIPTLSFVFVGGSTLTVNADRVMQNGISIRRSAYSGNNIEVGTVIAADLTVKLYNSDGFFDDYDFSGASCEVSISVDDGGTMRSVKLGYFTIDTVTAKNNTIELDGLDCMAELDVPYVDGDVSSNVFPCSLSNLFLSLNLALIAKNVPVVFSFLSDGFSIPNVTIRSMPQKDDMTYRQILSWLITLCGGSAYADTDNNGYIKATTLTTAAAGNIYQSHRINSQLSKDYVYCQEISLNGDVYHSTLTNITYSVKLPDNPFYDEISNSGTADKQAVLLIIWLSMYALYYPMTATVLPCPLYMPFDNLQYYTDESTHKGTRITDVSWTLNKNVSLVSAGISTTENGYASSSPVTSRQAEYIRSAVKTEQGDYILEIGTDSNGWVFTKYASGRYRAYREIRSRELENHELVAGANTAAAIYAGTITAPKPSQSLTTAYYKAQSSLARSPGGTSKRLQWAGGAQSVENDIEVTIYDTQDYGVFTGFIEVEGTWE